MRVLYVTVVPLHDVSNGGNIACRNHVRRLAQDPDVELMAIVACEPENAEATTDFLSQHAVAHRVIPFIPGPLRQAAKGGVDFLRLLATAAYQFPLEAKALNQEHVRGAVTAAARDFAVEVVVLDYTLTALIVDLDGLQKILGKRTVLIKLNREADFYRQQLRHGESHHGPLTGRISLRRLRRFERAIEARMAHVVTIGPLDHRDVRVPCSRVTPYLDPSPVQWHYRETRHAVFVGNAAHHPNSEAIDWLTMRLAPALYRKDSRIRLLVVGAERTAAPARWVQPNVDLLGSSGSDAVRDLLAGGADLSLCPVSNDFGVKFKALEALASGIPLLASAATLVGLPHLPKDAVLSMQNPDRDADLILSLMRDRGSLERLRDSQQAAQKSFEAEQAGAWSKILNS